MNRGPIFIGGLDRSGKTPLRLMLSCHPNIAMSRRTYMWTRFYGRYGDLANRANFERCLAAMLEQPQMRMLQPDPERIRREFWQGEPTYARLFALIHQHYAERVGKSRWGDQLGSIERYADHVFAAYPDAKMIHMIRDPRDRYEAAVTPARHRRGDVGGATARWRTSVALAKRNLERYVDCYLIVRYEALMRDPERTLREVCAFLDEEFVPGMLTLEHAMRCGFGDDDAADQAAEQAAARSSPGENGQHVLSKQDLAFMQAYARHEMLTNGYQPRQIRWSLSERLRFCAVDWPANMARMLAWQTLEAKHTA